MIEHGWGFQKPVLGTPISRGLPLGQALDAYWGFREQVGSPVVNLKRASLALPAPTFQGSAAWGVSRFGPSLSLPTSSGIEELRYSGAGITYNLPQTRGTVVVDTIAKFAPNDSLEHGPCVFTIDSGDNYFDMNKYSDNNLYMGWVTATVDQRIAVTATGWTAGDRVQFALAWDTGLGTTERAYVNAIEIGTRATALTTFDTASGGVNNRIRLGNTAAVDDTAFSFGPGSIGWVGVFDRMLTADELALLMRSPFAMYAPPAMQRWARRAA